MKDIVRKLKMSLMEKNPTLLLGAGFSYGTRNNKGELLPTGNGLVNRLYEEMFINNPSPKFAEDKDAAETYSADGKLKDMCSLLAQEKRKEERDKLITECFLGATAGEKEFYSYLVLYKWDRIFTLNIDDLVENIFEKANKPLTVWHKEKADRRNDNSNTVLVKLHGSVLYPQMGYIFDEDEYANFYNESSYLLNDFGDAFVKGDVIFIGTEFQEQDLKQIINKYESKGYNTSSNNYFFICPQINDPILRRKINETSNYHFLPWTTQTFLEFLKDSISFPREVKYDLEKKGMIVLNDCKKNVNPYYESKLYTGREPKMEDFIFDWDIEHPGLAQYVEKIEKHKMPVVAAITGKSYVGKTCFAMRVLLELDKKGYHAVKFDLKSSEYINLFIEYMKTFPNATKIAVLFEDAAFYYNILYPILLKQCPSNIKKLVVITTDIKRNYFIRKDILYSNNAVIEFQIDLKISSSFANNIYNKLHEKEWLNRPGIHGSNAREIKQYAIDTNDIIAFLYNITHGRGFEQHYEDIILKHTNTMNIKYLQMLSLLNTLGINKVPQRIFPQLLVEHKREFDILEFENEFEEILVVDNAYIKLRCQRLIQNVLMKGLSNNERKNIIVEIVKQTVGQFNEGDINEWSEIFQKVLSVKALLGESVLGISEIRTLLNEVEHYSKPYSYYWIQRGLSAQKEKEYDLADNYFRAAIRIRYQSYQAHHALAKNLMERAIDLLDKSDGYAPYYMNEGEKEIRKIIENPAYSRGLVYSIHTYIDMKLKYWKKTGCNMSRLEIEYIVKQIEALPKDTVDSYMKQAVEEFIRYASENGMGKDVYVLKYHDFGYISNGVAEEYEIENQDIDN